MTDVVARATAQAVLMLVVTSPYPLSQPVIASSINRSERQTQRALAQLAEARKLARQHREGEGRRNCVYRAADLRLRGALATARAGKQARTALLALFGQLSPLSRAAIAHALGWPASRTSTLCWMLDRLVADGVLVRERISGQGNRGTVYRLSATARGRASMEAA